jgi:hypothetical protein
LFSAFIQALFAVSFLGSFSLDNPEQLYENRMTRTIPTKKDHSRKRVNTFVLRGIFLA